MYAVGVNEPLSRRKNMSHRIEEVRRMFRERGGSEYGGEAVTQQEHALQAAMLAERAGAEAALVAAALLHDVGHLLHDLPADAPDQGIDDGHEHAAARWLAEWLPPETVEPVRLHVAAKRYLCATDPVYHARLSAPSIQSLKLQGGPMSEAEVAAFRASPHFSAAVRLRAWDEAAKVPGLPTPDVEHYLKAVKSAAGIGKA
jgi:phosphonate degradation associated HDIG domain protein